MRFREEKVQEVLMQEGDIYTAEPTLTKQLPPFVVYNLISPVKSSCQQSSIDTLAATKVFFSRNVKVSIFHVLYQSIAPHPIPMTLPNDIRHDDDDIPEISSQRT